MRTLIRSVEVLVVTVLASACTTSQSALPSLSGPSDFATSLSVTATPDSINQDGASRATVTVSAHDASGQPRSGLSVRVDMSVGGVPADFGTLSSRNLVTGSNGLATVTYTAPPAPPPSAAGSFSSVTIVATPVGTNAAVSANSTFSATIRLVPAGIIQPPAGTPFPAFAVTPEPVLQNVNVRFDATASTSGTNAGAISSYAWTFGDGGTASGAIVDHTFTGTGTFTVTLTVVNDRGIAASTPKSVTVNASAGPIASFTFSPTGSSPVGSTIFFNADGSVASLGRRLTQASWDFGDGSPAASGFQTSHQWNAAGTYTVTLVVTDDAGQKGAKSSPVPVGIVVVP